MLSLPGQNPGPSESRSRPAKHCKWGSDTSEQDCPHNGSPREAPPAGMCAQFAERRCPAQGGSLPLCRSEEHTSELQSLMRISYAVFCLKKKNKKSLDL